MSELEIETDDRGVATVWLNNPRHLNALSNAMVVALCEALPRLGDDAACRAIVLRGRAGVFCAGRELGDLKALQAAAPDRVAEMYRFMQTMNEVIYYSPKPTISLVERYALGIGTMLATWTDITLAEQGAQFGYPEVHHGITPYGAVPTMLNTMGQKALLELLLTGRRIDAAEAVRLGLVTRAVPAGSLDRELEAVLGLLSRGSAAAIAKSKSFVRECEGLSYREGIATATGRAIQGIGMPELREGLTAFLERKRADRPREA